jgi:hypothetical protein
MNKLLEEIYQWLEAPQIVLLGTETLILSVLILIFGFIWFKSGRKGD